MVFMPRKNKKRSGQKIDRQRAHAKRKAHIRYDLNLTDQTEREIISLIQSRDPMVVQSLDVQSNRVTVYSVLYDNRYLAVVYDSQRKTLVTFLPPIYFLQKGIMTEDQCLAMYYIPRASSIPHAESLMKWDRDNYVPGNIRG